MNKELINELFKAISCIRNTSECEAFFLDLCTPSELRAMSERWHVAKMIDKNVPYRNIYESTGVSTATITRVARSLNNGNNGYRNLIDKINNGEKS